MRINLMGHHAVVLALLVLAVLSAQPALAQQALNQAAATALARQLEAAVAKGDAAAADATLDIDAFLDRAMAGVSAPADFATGFRSGARRSWNFMQGIIKNAQGGGYRFLRVRQVDGQTRALFRLLPKSGGVNYHDWIVGTDSQGHARFQDVYIAMTGETMAQTMHRLYVLAAVQGNPTVLDKLSGAEKQYAANLNNVLQISRDEQQGDFRGALTTYKALPQDLRENKAMMVMRLAAASRLKEQLPQEYNAAMSDFRRLFPRDACIDLVCMDQLIEAQDYPQARQALDRIEAFTGQDAYLDTIRANLYRLQGGPANLAAAEKEFNKAIAIEPSLAEPYWGLVTLSLQTADYDRTAKLLDRIHRDLHIQFADLEKLPEYSGFVKSDAYRKWKAAQRARPQ